MGIADGDTLTVLSVTFEQHKVRIAGIDAPERGQPFGARAKASLGVLVMGRSVHVEWNKQDRYRRVVGTVSVGSVDVGLEQIRTGMAWHYTQYAREQRPADRLSYGVAEEQARRLGRGLWADSAPQAPWVYRAKRREAGSKTPPELQQVNFMRMDGPVRDSPGVLR